MTEDTKQENFKKLKHFLEKIDYRIANSTRKGLSSGEVLNLLFDSIAAQRYLKNLKRDLDI